MFVLAMLTLYLAILFFVWCLMRTFGEADESAMREWDRRRTELRDGDR